MLTLFTAAAVLAACACLRQLLNRPERTDAYFWKGRVRLTALWNDGAAFGLPLKRTLVTALSILILPLVWVFRRRSPIGADWPWEEVSATCGSGCGAVRSMTMCSFPSCRRSAAMYGIWRISLF